MHVMGADQQALEAVAAQSTLLRICTMHVGLFMQWVSPMFSPVIVRVDSTFTTLRTNVIVLSMSSKVTLLPM
jgi:hypothetical protein